MDTVSTVGAASTVGRHRIGDAERERAVARLGEHVGAGRLDLAEFEERSARVYAARVRDDVDAVFADLPGPAAPARPRTDARRGHRVAMTAVWGSWLFSSVVCLAIWAIVALATGSAGHFWPMWVIGPWGVALAMGTATGGRVCGARHARRPA